MMSIKARLEWLGETINLPKDIQLRLSIDPPQICIELVPQSPLGKLFAYKASENAKLKLISAYLLEKEYQQINRVIKIMN